MAGFSEDVWKTAITEVLNQFELESLLPEQEQSIRAFFEGSSVFVNLPTGYGKSLIFQCLPIVADVLYFKPRGSHVLVVISPLRSLMEDQVSFLNNIGVPAIAIGDEEDPEIIQQVINGNYIIVFGSPECMLSTPTWRGIFNTQSFKELLIGVAIDEAHCITQWGLPGAKKVPFRKWYGCLGELSSLIPKECHLMVLTATATKSTKQQILDTLHLSVNDIQMVEQSPDRPNLLYVSQYLDKNEPLEKEFGSLITELKTKGTNTPRTLIYCQTRKQCSVLFRMFEVFLGKKMFHGKIQPPNRLFEMFHAGTPPRVKDHICKNMAQDHGHLRVLISTVAFGMGINCKKVRRIVHFGPSKTVEMYVQECGRAGRDGLPSTCILLYNGLLSVHCDSDMKRYLQVEGCSRQWLMAHFGCKPDQSSRNCMHECCGFCINKCKCGECGKFWSPQLDNRDNLPDLTLGGSDEDRSKFTRVVTEKQKNQLRKKLQQLQQDMLARVHVKMMVTCPNVLLEFNSFHINQVVERCHHLFTMEDVLESVEIWRSQYAIDILRVLNEIFGDIKIELPSLEEQHDFSNTVFSDWSEIRNDSSLLSMLDSQLEGLDSFMDTEDESQSTFGDSGN